MTDALGWADAQVAVARDDPSARLALMERLFRGPTGRAPRHLPFRRGVVVHAVAGPARPPQPGRRGCAGQRLVAGDERGLAARRM
jgi:hypothetical protein